MDRRIKVTVRNARGSCREGFRIQRTHTPIDSAAAPVAVAAAVPNAAAEAVEEKTEFDVILKETGPKKIDVIKALRQLTTLGLVDAKTMAETAGAKVLTQVGKEAANGAKEKLEGAGAVVELA